MTKTIVGKYMGRREINPGKMQFREKGVFMSEKGAREYQASLKARGMRTKVVHYPGSYYPWAVYVMAKHDFWKRNFKQGE